MKTLPCNTVRIVSGDRKDSRNNARNRIKSTCNCENDDGAGNGARRSDSEVPIAQHASLPEKERNKFTHLESDTQLADGASVGPVVRASPSADEKHVPNYRASRC